MDKDSYTEGIKELMIVAFNFGVRVGVDFKCETPEGTLKKFKELMGESFFIK